MKRIWHQIVAWAGKFRLLHRLHQLEEEIGWREVVESGLFRSLEAVWDEIEELRYSDSHDHDLNYADYGHEHEASDLAG